MGETRIREALELLDGGRRWKQGDWGDPSHRMCVAGALRCAWTGGVEELPEVGRPDLAALARIAYEFLPSSRLVSKPSDDDEDCNIDVVATLNDYLTTTFADVELVMEKAAIMREEAVG